MRTLVLALASVAAGYALGQLNAPRAEPRSDGRARRADERHHVDIVQAPPATAPESAQSEEDAALSLVEAVICPGVASGTGCIRGEVVDENHLPVAGVTVTALPQNYPDAGPYRANPLARYAARRKWEAAARRTARTDGAGRYVIEGLADDLYSLRAELRGFSFSGWRWNVYPGAVANFAASPVVEVSVRILLPDGAVAPFALLEVMRGGSGMTGVWSPHDEQRHLVPGPWTLKARHPLRETLASDPVEVEATWGVALAPVVLRLEEKPWIRGTLSLLSGEIPPRASIYLLPASGRSPPDPSAFWTADESGGRRVELEDETGGTFGIFDLGPGIYWIAAAVPDGEIEACTRVDVGAGGSMARLQISGEPKPSPLAVLDDSGDG